MTRIAITAGSTGGSTRRAATHYGRREHEVAAPAAHSVEQGVEALEFVVDHSSFPTFGTDELILRIPANSRIVEASFHVTEAFAGTDNSSTNDFIEVGLYQPDSTVIDADGLIKIAALTDIDAVGDVQDGAGALVGVSVGANDAQVVVTLDPVVGTSTLTAGRAMLYVKYQRIFDRIELND